MHWAEVSWYRTCGDIWCRFIEAYEPIHYYLDLTLPVVGVVLHILALPVLLSRRMRGGVSAIFANLSIIFVLQYALDILSYSIEISKIGFQQKFPSSICYDKWEAEQSKVLFFQLWHTFYWSEYVLTVLLLPAVYVMYASGRERRCWKVGFLIIPLMACCTTYSLIDYFNTPIYLAAHSSKPCYYHSKSRNYIENGIGYDILFGAVCFFRCFGKYSTLCVYGSVLPLQKVQTRQSHKAQLDDT